MEIKLLKEEPDDEIMRYSDRGARFISTSVERQFYLERRLNLPDRPLHAGKSEGKAG